MERKNLIEIGTIVSVKGLKGELKVKTDSDFPERFETPGVRWISLNSSQSLQEVELLKGEQIPGKNIFIIKLAGINDRTQGENLLGSKLFASLEDKPTLEENEYHVRDLINLEVYHQLTGEKIGIIVDIFTAGNDVLEVELHHQPQVKEKKTPDIDKINRVSKRRKFKEKKVKPLTVLIPFVEEIVPIVDIKNQRVEINPPQGLLNLDLADNSDEVMEC